MDFEQTATIEYRHPCVMANQECFTISHWEIFCSIVNFDLIKKSSNRNDYEVCETRDSSLGDQKNKPAICRVSPCPHWSLIFCLCDRNYQLLSLTGIHIISVKVIIETGFHLSKILHRCFPGRTQTAYLTSSPWLFPQTLIESCHCSLPTMPVVMYPLSCLSSLKMPSDPESIKGNILFFLRKSFIDLQQRIWEDNNWSVQAKH